MSRLPARGSITGRCWAEPFAVAAFDPDVTKWLQGSLNVLLDPSPNLVVDGRYGTMTRNAVEQLQTKLGLRVDGWAGEITKAAIAAALAKLR